MRSGRADGMARVEGEVRAPSSETDSTRHSAVPGSRQGRAPAGWRHSAGSVVLAIVSGIGSAAFHPQASSMVSSVSGSRPALAMSIFQLGGNVGFSLGPVLVAYLWTVGVERTLSLMPFGLLVSLLLFLWAPPPPRARPRPRGERHAD